MAAMEALESSSAQLEPQTLTEISVTLHHIHLFCQAPCIHSIININVYFLLANITKSLCGCVVKRHYGSPGITMSSTPVCGFSVIYKICHSPLPTQDAIQIKGQQGETLNHTYLQTISKSLGKYLYPHQSN